MAYLSKKVLLENIKAIKLAVQLNKEKRIPSEEEIEIINRYKGWGGLKFLLYPIEEDWSNSNLKISKEDLSLESDAKNFYDFLKQEFPDNYEEILRSIKSASLTSYFTPKEVVNVLIEQQAKTTPYIESFLDPSAGMGVYVDNILEAYPNIKSIVAVEADFLTSFLLKEKYKGIERVEIINSKFEDVNFGDKKFDFIASNIPFGDIKVSYNYDDIITNKIHNFFVYHSGQLLHQGGRFSFISSVGLMNSSSNKQVREKIAENCTFESIYCLPDNLFIDNGTQVSTHIITAKRTYLKSEKEIKFNQLFIDTNETEEGIRINNYISLNWNKAHLGSDRNFQVGTNPYGNKEYNYQLNINDLVNDLRNNLYFSKQDIKSIEKNDQIKWRALPINYNIIEDYGIREKEQLLAPFELTDEQKIDFRIAGIIKGVYKGKIFPIATIIKLNSRRDKITNIYAIDIFSEEASLIKFKNKQFVDGREFKKNFTQFGEAFKKYCEQYNITPSLEIAPTEMGQRFRDYFQKTFKFPDLKSLYKLSLEHFSFHKEVHIGSVYLDEENTIRKVIDINVNNGIYEVEKVQIKSTIEKEIIQGALSIYNRYSRVIEIEKEFEKLKQKTSKNIWTESFHTANEIKLDTAINNLNREYDIFIKKYGAINENSSIISKWLYEYAPILKSLENYQQKPLRDLFSPMEQEWIKADIFTKKYERDENQLEVLISPEEAMVKSFNINGTINIKDMKSWTGYEETELLRSLEGKIIFNPISKEYEFQEIFLSGNIYKKIDEILNLEKVEGVSYEKEKELLKKILPEKVNFTQIYKQFGARWIPIEYFQKYANEYIARNFASQRQSVKLYFEEESDTFIVSPEISKESWDTNFLYQTKGGRYIYPDELFEKALYNQYYIPTYTVEIDGKKITQTDHEGAEYFKRNINQIKNGWANFLSSLPEEEKQELEIIYNRRFNAIVIPESKGEILNFENMDLKAMNIDNIYPHQKNAIWKALINQGGLIDHEVGFGKTLTMCGLAHKLKALKIVKKPVILGLKANVKELAHTYQKLFPDAKILYSDKDEYSKANREVFLNKIKNNDWDCVFLSHEQFKKIPQDDKTLLNIYEGEMKEMQDNLLKAANYVTKKQLKGLEQRIKSLEVKRDKILKKLEKNSDDNVLGFQDLGIDHIIIDESHKYKNLGFQTRHTRIAGLGSTEGNDLTINILSAIRSVQMALPNREFGATFFSGTPISNSLTELYSIQKYLIPERLKDRGIANFDSWASVFTEKSVDFETNMVGKIISKERFRKFENMPELALMYNEMAHIMNGNISPELIERPQKNEYLSFSEQTPLQKKFFRELEYFLNTNNQGILNLSIPLNQDDKNQATSILAMTLSFKASVDMRMINVNYPDHPNSKVNKLVKDIVQTYYQYEKQKGTQVVFSDIGKKKNNLTFEELEYNYQNNIFTSLDHDILYKLIKSGIPQKEIAFAGDWANKKEELSAKVNKGEIRVIIGGTETAGTGLNIQKRLSKIHHLTIPWKPSELEQRNGRGYRKGNWIAKEHNDNKIDISICVTKNTLDNYKFDINKNKGVFIEQIREAHKLKVRSIDEGEMDENAGVNLATLQAQLMGDNSLLEKSKNDRLIKELMMEKQFITEEVYTAKRKIKGNNERIEELEYIINLLEEDLKIYENNIVYDKKGAKVNLPEYNEISNLSSAEDIDHYFKEVIKKLEKESRDTKYPIAKMWGFELAAYNHFYKGVQFKVNRIGNEVVKYEINNGYINFDNKNGAKNYFLGVLNTISRRLTSNKNMLKYLKDENEKLLPKTKLIFDEAKEARIEELQNYGLELEKRIKKFNETKDTVLPVRHDNERATKMYLIEEKKHLDELFLGVYLENNSFETIEISSEMIEILKEAEKMSDSKYLNITEVGKLQNGNLKCTFFIKDIDLFYNDIGEIVNRINSISPRIEKKSKIEEEIKSVFKKKK